MKQSDSEKLNGTVEADETFIGGKYDRRRHRECGEKPCVVGVTQGGGPVRAEKIKSRRARANAAFIKESVDSGSNLMTDEYRGYLKVGKLYNHSTVNHSKLEYAEGSTHTNSIENFWSLFTRGLVGSFHRVSEKHLDRYLDEFIYRFNGREDGQLFQNTLRNLVNGETLTFEKLTKTA